MPLHPEIDQGVRSRKMHVWTGSTTTCTTSRTGDNTAGRKIDFDGHLSGWLQRVRAFHRFPATKMDFSNAEHCSALLSRTTAQERPFPVGERDSEAKANWASPLLAAQLAGSALGLGEKFIEYPLLERTKITDRKRKWRSCIRSNRRKAGQQLAHGQSLKQLCAQPCNERVCPRSGQWQS
jgi:hypothetical protein